MFYKTAVCVELKVASSIYVLKYDVRSNRQATSHICSVHGMDFPIMYIIAGM